MTLNSLKKELFYNNKQSIKTLLSCNRLEKLYYYDFAKQIIEKS